MFLLSPDESAEFFAFQNGQSRNVTLTSNRLVNRLVSRSRFTLNRFSLQCRSLSVAAAMLMVQSLSRIVGFASLLNSSDGGWYVNTWSQRASVAPLFSIVLEWNVNYLWKSIPKVHLIPPSGEEILDSLFCENTLLDYCNNFH